MPSASWEIVSAFKFNAMGNFQLASAKEAEAEQEEGGRKKETTSATWKWIAPTEEAPDTMAKGDKAEEEMEIQMQIDRERERGTAERLVNPNLRCLTVC